MHSHLDHRLTLTVLAGTFSICKLDKDAAVPAWATAGDFLSITRTSAELSIVCPQLLVPNGVQVEPGWRCLRVAGQMPFSVVGVLVSLVTPLAESGITVLAISTFDTDYVLVKEQDLEKALVALQAGGLSILS